MSYLQLYPVAFMDSPRVLDASITAIPASGGSVLQVVASLAKEARAIRFTDSTGQLIEVYEGALGQEVLRGQLGGPTQELPCHLSKGSRVSLRAAENTAITTGTLYLQFMGQL